MEREKTTNMLLISMGALILLMIVITVCTVHKNVLTGICRLISLSFVALYGFWLYKRPHGNLLKYAMLLMAATDILNSAAYIANEGTLLSPPIIRLFTAAGVVYCAGRLDRIDQNKIILPIMDALLLIFAIISILEKGTSFGVMYLFRFFGSFILLSTLMIAYFLRYKEHRLAGTMDKE